MPSSLRNWETKNGSLTIKPVKKSGYVPNEVDEEGKEAIANKSEKEERIENQINRRVIESCDSQRAQSHCSLTLWGAKTNSGARFDK